MNQSEIEAIEEKLKIKLPRFYVNTMLNYPFLEDSFASEFSLCTDVNQILRINSVFKDQSNIFSIGSDGGEFIYFIKLDGSEKVFIYDYEGSDRYLTVEAKNWSEYLKNIEFTHEEIRADEEKMAERKRNKKWWQFWI